jgi:hypothetical protein
MTIDYDRGKPETYRGVLLSVGIMRKLFCSENPAQDYTDALQYCEHLSAHTINDPSVENFATDGNEYHFIDGRLVTKKIKKTPTVGDLTESLRLKMPPTPEQRQAELEAKQAKAQAELEESNQKYIERATKFAQETDIYDPEDYERKWGVSAQGET